MLRTGVGSLCSARVLPSPAHTTPDGRAAYALVCQRPTDALWSPAILFGKVSEGAHPVSDATDDVRAISGGFSVWRTLSLVAIAEVTMGFTAGQGLGWFFSIGGSLVILTMVLRARRTTHDVLTETHLHYAQQHRVQYERAATARNVPEMIRSVMIEVDNRWSIQQTEHHVPVPERLSQAAVALDRLGQEAPAQLLTILAITAELLLARATDSEHVASIEGRLREAIRVARAGAVIAPNESLEDAVQEVLLKRTNLIARRPADRDDISDSATFELIDVAMQYDVVHAVRDSRAFAG